jgi:hypothetical protein
MIDDYAAYRGSLSILKYALQLGHPRDQIFCVHCDEVVPPTVGYRIVVTDDPRYRPVICGECSRHHAPELLQIRPLVNDLYWARESQKTGQSPQALRQQAQAEMDHEMSLFCRIEGRLQRINRG